MIVGSAIWDLVDFIALMFLGILQPFYVNRCYANAQPIIIAYTIKWLHLLLHLELFARWIWPASWVGGYVLYHCNFRAIFKLGLKIFFVCNFSFCGSCILILIYWIIKPRVPIRGINFVGLCLNLITSGHFDIFILILSP